MKILNTLKIRNKKSGTGSNFTNLENWCLANLTKKADKVSPTLRLDSVLIKWAVFYKALRIQPQTLWVWISPTL